MEKPENVGTDESACCGSSKPTFFDIRRFYSESVNQKRPPVVVPSKWIWKEENDQDFSLLRVTDVKVGIIINAL